MFLRNTFSKQFSKPFHLERRFEIYVLKNLFMQSKNNLPLLRRAKHGLCVQNSHKFDAQNQNGFTPKISL